MPKTAQRLSLSMTSEYFDKLSFLHAYHQSKAHAAGFFDPMSRSQIIRLIIQDAFKVAMAEEDNADAYEWIDPEHGLPPDKLTVAIQWSDGLDKIVSIGHYDPLTGEWYEYDDSNTIVPYGKGIPSYWMSTPAVQPV